VRESIVSVDSPRNILQIARITFAVELLAAVALSVVFLRRGIAPAESIFQGVFHAIMGFCNAGLVDLESGSFIPYAGDWLVVGTLSLVIILGGLEFPVLVDLYHYRKDRRLTVHSRLVLITSAVLLLVGVIRRRLGHQTTHPALQIPRGGNSDRLTNGGRRPECAESGARRA
jgi:trk system potassium uptake protein TrkH